MVAYKLEKNISVYKTQFDKLMSDIYGDHRIERLSMDIDAIMFRIKYMCKHDLDMDKIQTLKGEFLSKTVDLRNAFGIFLYELLVGILGFERTEIEDVLAQDVNIDSTYVKFKMILVSKNHCFLEKVDDSIPENTPLNIFPNEFFRVFTDSYNDGVARAYPELFVDRHKENVGVGADGDVFVHNFTFQTTEACSLNCTYCFGKGTMIKMADGRSKVIEDVKVGDLILGFPEKKPRGKDEPPITTSLVKATSHHLSSCVELSHPYLGTITRMTRDHKVLTDKYKWIAIGDADPCKDGLYIYSHGKVSEIFVYRVENIKHDLEMVYNLETTTGTYIANNLLVHNCYQTHKTPMKMSFETAKEFIDNLLADKYSYINRYNSPAIIIEFIGGEPFLQIDLTRKIYEYFLEQTYKLNHPWFTLHRLSICSNGLQYFDEEVQNFFKDYASQISFNISIDGNQELHDSCRIQPNGEGSYDIDIAALNHYNANYTAERNSKMTLAPQNIQYLYDSVVNFIENGMTCINLNCVFEEGWDQDTARVEYEQLKKLANYLLDNDLEHLYIAIFNERQEDMQDKFSDGNHCGGLGSMLAMRPNGQFYPCLRYMPTSVGDNVADLCIGTVQDGMIGREEGSEILQMMDNITRRSQSNDICFECPLGNSCAWCSALGHTVYGTPGKRPMFICIQVIAEALANVYYWNLLSIKHPEYRLPVRKNVVPDKWALLVIDHDELDYLKKIEAYAMMIKLEQEAKDE